ncbi:MAG: hypothetical protein BWY54_00535 [Candidatus Dependentiae bacterium ADurb.Bin331]|nr:MAG: hypothetical protein BWY54_00535 [Candidatus Dependentiae bacterium ADurb.Bin331]
MMRYFSFLMYIHFVFLCSFLCCISVHGRSPFRTPEPHLPVLLTNWSNETKKYELASSYLQEGPLFHLYDPVHFKQHLLPTTNIAFRYDPEQSVNGTELANLIETLLVEIKNKKQKKFKHFKVIKKRDFNFKKQTGFLVLKFRNYPFVLKLFITSPEQFLKPFDYGFESCCFFIMGGGVNRYLSGFTRIKNLERLKEYIAKNEDWRPKIDFPRKWFWIPRNNRSFTITGFNIGTIGTTHQIELPSAYALVCDEINIGHTFSLTCKENRDTALELSNFLQQQIDPHINNFVIDKINKKIVLIDTEHFPTMVGLEQPTNCTNYLTWYLDLSWKMFQDSFCRTKRTRREFQTRARNSMNFFSTAYYS